MVETLQATKVTTPDVLADRLREIDALALDLAAFEWRYARDDVHSKGRTVAALQMST